MKISELPQEIKEKALEYQRDAPVQWNKITDYLEDAFDWYRTSEGGSYWLELDESEPQQPTQTNQLRQLRTVYELYDTTVLQQLWSDGEWREIEIVTIEK